VLKGQTQVRKAPPSFAKLACREAGRTQIRTARLTGQTRCPTVKTQLRVANLGSGLFRAHTSHPSSPDGSVFVGFSERTNWTPPGLPCVAQPESTAYFLRGAARVDAAPFVALLDRRRLFHCRARWGRGWGSVHYPSTGRYCLPRRLGGVRAPNERALGLQGAKVSVKRRASFLDFLHPRGGVLDGGFSLILGVLSWGADSPCFGLAWRTAFWTCSENYLLEVVSGL
jgi:hypothetical protein